MIKLLVSKVSPIIFIDEEMFNNIINFIYIEKLKVSVNRYHKFIFPITLTKRYSNISEKSLKLSGK
mgnify:CR=1 FL=1